MGDTSRDRIAIALCAVGAWVLARGAGSESIAVSVVIEALPFVALFLATGRRAILAALGLAAVAVVLASLWDLVPTFLWPESRYQFGEDHPVLDAAPEWLGIALRRVALAVALGVAGDRAGRALAGIASGALALALLAQLGGLPFASLSREAFEGSPGFFLSLVEAGATRAGHLLGAASLLSVALARDVVPAPRRPLALVAAIGGALVIAVLVAFPRSTSSSRIEVTLGVSMLVLAIGWLALAIGVGALARESAGTRVAWVGLGGILAQLVACPITLVMLEGSARHGTEAALEIATIALVGLAVTALVASPPTLRPVLRAGGVALAVAAVGGCCLPFEVLLDTTGVVRGIREPFWIMEQLSVPFAPFGLAAWVAWLALRAAPPIAGVPAGPTSDPSAGPGTAPPTPTTL